MVLSLIKQLVEELINLFKKQLKPILPSESISSSSISFGMLSCIANNAAAAGQKATRGILIFSATSRAHPRFSSAITQLICQDHFYPRQVSCHLGVKPGT